MAAAKLLLKARPTPTQLADRLRPVEGVWPDGLELYLAAADLASPAIVEAIAERILATETPAGFVWLIEGPIDSLDGTDFDVARHSPADVLMVERLAHLARRIGARAVNIHVISPGTDVDRLTLQWRDALLHNALALLVRFVSVIQEAGAVPTVENMPPVLRMRRSDYAFTPIGMASADLRWLADRVPGLRVLVDTSHTGLYLNARRLEPDRRYGWSEPLARYLRQLPDDGDDLVGFMQSLAALVENAQISNASGVLGEGLPYGEGEFDLDPAIRWLGDHAQHIVTETIEPNNDHAVFMRDALRRARMALA